MHEHLSVKKFGWKWVPRLLTVDQKQESVNDSERCLELFQRNKMDVFMRYETMNEIWIHHYTPESNWQSAEWTANGENRPKRPKTQMSAGKVLAPVFWDAHGILFIYYLGKEITINSKYYMALLLRLKEEIGKKRPQIKKKKVLFEFFPHPPHSPDLAPSDYYLFTNLKRMLHGERFGSNEEVIAETEAYFETKDKSFYKKSIKILENHWYECITLEEDYDDE